MPPDGHSETRRRGLLSSDALFEGLPGVVYATDATGRLLKWNDGFAALTGYDDDELSSMTRFDVLTPSSTTTDREHTDEGTFRGTVQTASDEMIPCEYSERGLTDDTGTVVGRCGTIRPDVSGETVPSPHDDAVWGFESVVASIPDVALVHLTPTGGVLTWNDGARRLHGYRRDEVLGQHVSVLYTSDDVDAGVPDRLFADAERDGHADAEGWCVRKDGSSFWATVGLTPVTDDQGRHDGFTMLLRDSSSQHEQATRLRRQHDELETLNLLSRLVRTLVRHVAEGSTHESIEQVVCQRLADADRYLSAVVVEPELDGDQLTSRVSAGDDGAHEAITQTARDSGMAMSAGEVFRTNHSPAPVVFSTASDVPDAVRQVAADYGVSAALAVPLSFGDTVYAVLVVYSADPEAFTEREQRGFEVLGRTVGFAMNASQNLALLFSDSLVELEFRSTDRASFFIDLSARYGCTCRLDGQVLAADERLLQYMTVTGVAPRDVLALAETREEFEAVRLITAEGDSCLVEVAITVSGLKSLLDAGAYVRSATIEDGVATIVADIAKGQNVRSVVRAFQSVYPDSTLVSKRDYDRPTHTVSEFRQRLAGNLTDRQQAALRTAYLAGYFDWPRGSTAEEVAVAMDISSATLHYHLRRAQYELIEMYFDEGDG